MVDKWVFVTIADKIRGIADRSWKIADNHEEIADRTAFIKCLAYYF